MKNLYKALAKFNEEVPVIHQEIDGYNYTYANLSAIFKVIKPLLVKHELGFTQLLNGNSLKTIVFHIESGESLESEVNIPQDVKLNSMNTFQVIGSAITYYRRYSLSALLGLVTDKDIDACGNQIPPLKTNIVPLTGDENDPKTTILTDENILSCIEKKTQLEVLESIEKGKYTATKEQIEQLKKK